MNKLIHTLKKSIGYVFGALLLACVFLSGNAFANEGDETLDPSESRMSLDERIQQLEAQVRFSPGATAPRAAAPPQTLTNIINAQSLEQELQGLKSEIIELNRELAVLEQDILTPVSSQTVLFLSIDKGHFFKLDGVKIQVNGKIVDHHLYTKQEIEALTKGAVQRVHTTNLPPGNHEVVVFLSGFSLDGRDVRQAAAYRFYKPNSKKYIELAIKDNIEKQRAEFEFSEWQ